MPIPVICPGCKTLLRPSSKLAGRRVICPKCKSSVTVPLKENEGSWIEKEMPPLAPLAPPLRPTPQPLVRENLPAKFVPDAELVPDDGTIECPYCAEKIRAAAKKCKHCGELLDNALRTSTAPAPQIIHVQKPKREQPAIHITNVNTNVVDGGRRVKRWSPIVAFFLSVLIPGLGQLYKGQLLNAIAWFFVVLLGYIALIIPGLILHLICAIGAASGDPYAS